MSKDFSFIATLAIHIKNINAWKTDDVERSGLFISEKLYKAANNHVSMFGFLRLFRDSHGAVSFTRRCICITTTFSFAKVQIFEVWKHLT